MYVRTRDELGDAISGNFDTRTTQSHLWQQVGNIYPGLGQPVPSIPACILKPKWIAPLKHFFSPKIRLTKGSGLAWESTPRAEELNPDLLNPGYFFTKTRGLARDPNLDKHLKELMATLLAKKPPFDIEPFKSFVNKGGKIRVALVDLSTDSKLVLPELAEFNAAEMTEGGSLAKLGFLYGAFQNRFDLNIQAKMDPRFITADRIDKLKSMYNINLSPSVAIEFNSDTRNALDGICSNCDASKISRSLTLSYVNSALWQSGLYDCRWGGIWAGAHYNEWNIKGSNKWECDKPPYLFKDNCTSEGCHRDPKGNFFVAVNALSVATFFTLLAQGRLVDDDSSQKLKNILVMQPDRCGSRFKGGLESAGRFATSDRIYSKIGVTTSLSHEGALIDRVSIGKKYVAVVLTISRAGGGGVVREKLIAHLDELVRANP